MTLIPPTEITETGQRMNIDGLDFEFQLPPTPKRRPRRTGTSRGHLGTTAFEDAIAVRRHPRRRRPILRRTTSSACDTLELWFNIVTP